MPTSPRLVLIAASVLVVAAVGVGGFFAVRGLSGDDDEAPAPPVALKEEEGDDDEPKAAEELGFPAFATKNTTRIGGNDEAADAAGAALATFPSVGGVDRPAAVTLVPSSDWAAGVAASVLVSDPIRAPILLGDDDGVPDETETALDAMQPEGSPETTDAQVLRVGDVEVPGGLRALEVPGGSAAEVANGVDKLRQRLSDEKPENIVLASTEDPAYAMPAAAWAARSGDPVLFVERDAVPEATIEALKRHEGVPAFLIGPELVASEKVVDEVEKHAPAVQRISGEDPVTSAIAFARFDAGTFGWNITDPGHGLVIANSSRPLDAAAAAPLSASGKWGPLLVSDDADAVPAPLRGFLLDIKPGYRSDPSRAFYNHAWLIGDNSALSVAFQAQVDDALELVRIETGAAGPRTGAARSGGRD
ncbi:MAG: hypothetical protein ACRDL3_10445 [Solirubrobacterales bacterium]